MALSVEDRLSINQIIAWHGHLVDSGQLDRLEEVFISDDTYDITDLGGTSLVGVMAMRDPALSLAERNPLATTSPMSLSLKAPTTSPLSARRVSASSPTGRQGRSAMRTPSFEPGTAGESAIGRFRHAELHCGAEESGDGKWVHGQRERCLPAHPRTPCPEARGPGIPQRRLSDRYSALRLKIAQPARLGLAWVYLAAHSRCVRCGGPAADVDHIVAKAQGGTDSEANLRAYCHACHSSRTGRDQGGFA